MNGLDWQKHELPLAAGLNQRFDDRARQPPFLDIALDCEFTEIGGVQTRRPFAALGALANCRRMVANGTELLVFTDTSLYSWDAANEVYVLKGTYLAVKVDERAVFVTTDDQIDADRAEIAGVVVFTWSVAGGTTVYLAAIDKETGATILAPTAITTAARPKLVALTSKILHFYVVSNTGVLRVKALDPADLATSIAASYTAIVALGTAGFLPGTAMYDAVKIPDADTAIAVGRLDPTTSYALIKVPAAVASWSAVAPARVCDGPIAVSCTPDGVNAQIIRANGTDIQGDLVTIGTLADTAHVGKAVGTATSTVYQIACAHRSVLNGGAYRCYAFWHSDENTSGSSDWSTKSNYVDSAGNLGTQAIFVRRLAVMSRAFDHGGSVYVTLGFGGNSSFLTLSSAFSFLRSQLQNTNFLYRDDGLLVAKVAPGRAGGFGATFSESLGRLPGVVLTDGTTTYSTVVAERRLVPIGEFKSTNYADRGPRDVAFTFDSNEARRCARLGQTLYITGGELMQYDGVRLVEVGFHIFPWFAVGTESNGTGSVEDGAYAYKGTLRYDNAKGERERSTTATHGDVTLTGGGSQRVIISDAVPLYVTHKTAVAPAFEIWRTAKDPNEGDPFFLVTSRDPASTSNPNRYLANDTSLADLADVNDQLADATLTNNEGDPETGGALENVAPPACSIIAASDTRLFIAGIPGDLDRVWYSQLRGDGQIAKFHDSLAFDVPRVGGNITAIAFIGGAVIVFRETAAYAFAGQGFGNLGALDGSQNFQLARTASEDVGAVSAESVVLTDKGLLFKSAKGWHILNNALGVDYVGAAIVDYDSDTVVAAHLLEGKHQIRILTTSRMLVFDTVASQWGEWTIDDGLHAAMWNGAYLYLATGGPKSELATYTGLDYGLDIETTWIKPSDLMGSVRLRWLQVLAEYRSAHDLRLRVAYDYVETYVDDRTWTVSPTTVGGPEQVRLGPSRQQCQAFKLRITAQAVNSATPPTGEALKLTGLGVELGFRKGLYRRLVAAQKV